MKLLKVVADNIPEGGSIPPAVSAKVRKVVREKDTSWEAAEAKLELAEAQLKDLNQRVEKIEEQYDS
jgi:hypothetical protein